MNPTALTPTPRRASRAGSLRRGLGKFPPPGFVRRLSVHAVQRRGDVRRRPRRYHRAHGAVGAAIVTPQRGGRRGDVRGRTVLVVSDGIELAVAVRDQVDRAYVTVRGVPPSEGATAVRACRPWPWMVIGDIPALSVTIAEALGEHPLLLFWCGAMPSGLPAHARGFARFSEMAAALRTALGAEVAGIRLAPGGGLTMPDGTHAGNAALEALVASHPHPVVAPMRDFRGALRAITAHRVPLCLHREGDGSVSLAAARGA